MGRRITLTASIAGCVLEELLNGRRSLRRYLWKDAGFRRAERRDSGWGLTGIIGQLSNIIEEDNPRFMAGRKDERTTDVGNQPGEYGIDSKHEISRDMRVESIEYLQKSHKKFKIYDFPKHASDDTYFVNNGCFPNTAMEDQLLPLMGKLCTAETNRPKILQGTPCSLHDR
ncbi:hypothetical protein TNCV_2405931 [Trichonephila clavipes]|nr:hypothetical protein TNCV_2405931 [Trichonephila clavipes]